MNQTGETCAFFLMALIFPNNNKHVLRNQTEIVIRYRMNVSNKKKKVQLIEFKIIVELCDGFQVEVKQLVVVVQKSPV